MIIRLFGATTPTGETLLDMLEKEFENIYCYSRTRKYIYLDLKEANIKFGNDINEKEIWINLAPIWLFASFIDKLREEVGQNSSKITGIITCSSSSVITKQFSWHKYDKDLVKTLKSSEVILHDICTKFNIYISIIRPTMIYGNSNNYQDKNISLIKKVCSLLPIIIFPNSSGLRQPISIKQLAKIIYQQLIKIKNKKYTENLDLITIGGDQTLSYFKLIKLIIKKNNLSCNIITIPNNVFFFILSPLLLINSKLYSELIRIESNLSGFKKSSEILSSKEESIFDNL